MNYADIAILAIMLISIIIGIVRGFWKSISKVIVLVASVVLAFTLADKLSMAIFNESALQSINALVSKAVLNTPYTNAQVINDLSGNLVAITSEGAVPIADALKGMLIPTFLHTPIIASAGGLSTSVTLGELVASAYTHMVALLAAGAIIFIASSIVLGVIANLIYRAFEYKKFHKAVDRILGGVLRIFTGAIFVIIVLNVLGTMSGFEFMTPVMTEIEAGAISGPLFEADLLNKIFYGEGMTKLLETFKNVIITVQSADPASAAAIASSLFI